jgi:pimeloyl-ACP methyl ester carboxylesterase
LEERRPEGEVKKNICSRDIRMSAGVVIMVVVLAALGTTFGVRTVARRSWRALERRWLMMTGGMVDAGGFYLRIRCIGSGSPAVVMDSGLNMPMQTWGPVPPAAAQFTRVCTYDRAGIGRSDPWPGQGVRTSDHVVRELHALLSKAGVAGPYVLVGHSFGGLNARLYASRYPKEVVGLVLVDSSHEDQYARFAALMDPVSREKYLRHERGGNDEGVDLEASAGLLRAAGPLPVVPLVVLSADQKCEATNAAMRRAASEMQACLAQLVPNGKQVRAAGSGHFIQLGRPELVIEAIRNVVSSARLSAPQLLTEMPEPDAPLWRAPALSPAPSPRTLRRSHAERADRSPAATVRSSHRRSPSS